jgi:hypothetical protein
MLYPEIAEAVKATVHNSLPNRVIHLLSMQNNTVCLWLEATFGDLSTDRVLTSEQLDELTLKIYEVRDAWTAVNPIGYRETLMHTMYTVDANLQPEFGIPDTLDPHQLKFVVAYLEKLSGAPVENKGTITIQ